MAMERFSISLVTQYRKTRYPVMTNSKKPNLQTAARGDARMVDNENQKS
jgi:hypothetical protein